METLSDKRNDIDYNHEAIYSESDVREFIKKLKEGLIASKEPRIFLKTSQKTGTLDIIDKLAGDKLI